MRIRRMQWPVGQGCFATGRINAGTGAVNYVYDCGARSVKHLEPLVETYAKDQDRIDALFVSHLDGDHVDGLDTLLARVDVTNVYLPYLSAEERLLRVVEAGANGERVTGSFLQAQFDPSGWFGSRGVGRVVLVRNGGPPDEEAAGGGEPIGPDGRDGDGRGSPGLVEKGRVLTDDLNAQRPADNAQMFEMLVGAVLQLQIAGQPQDWILKPYVPRVNQDRERAFGRRVREMLGVPSYAPLDPARLGAALKSDDGRRRLRACYDAILPDGAGSQHNAVSMSLYSGPASDTGSWDVRGRRDDWPFWRGGPQPGWIGTGDAQLNRRKQRQKWLSFYRDELTRTGTLLLPHHGSKANFHPDLLRSTLRHFVAAADDRDAGYKHPSSSVVDAISGSGRTLIHVSKQPLSRFEELIERV